MARLATLGTRTWALVLLVGFAAMVCVGVWAFWKQASYDQPVENGVRQIVMCGEDRGTLLRSPVMDEMLDAVPGEAEKGVWGMEEDGDCNVWTHYADSD